MVSYEQWFKAVHETDAAQRLSTPEERGRLTSELAEYWQAEKQDIKAMSMAEARQLAAGIVN